MRDDGFGNVLETKIVGKTVSTNTYAPNNGMLTRTIYADGSRTSADYDAYGRVTGSYITEAGGKNTRLIPLYMTMTGTSNGTPMRQTDSQRNTTLTTPAGWQGAS